MVKTNYYNGLNPAVSQALINLQYRYSDETPEMWCSRIRYPFRTLLENNPKYFSKNGFIQMVERVYIDWEFKAERCSFNIYCTVCDTLVFIRENIIECANHHLNECIAKTAKRHFAHSNPIQKKGGRNVSSLSSDEVDEIFMNYSIYPQHGYCVYNTENEFREKIAYALFNGAKIIQRAWRAFKLRPETWAKRVWNMVRNDGTPDKKKFLGVILQKIKNPYTRQQHDLHSAKIIAIINKGYNYPLPGEYKEYYLPNNWMERKKEQLNN
ncbi:hypothetical protein C2G38_2240706 [Gigaspora rosea]|uniref:Uncharacterized protein n=1 Tax=Gigaspora rosea TaxID=44941 RepID=A0A397VX90_9GLOM|nr:hypothetical protein C2G38_2240706 [Gigaspora rosea]